METDLRVVQSPMLEKKKISELLEVVSAASKEAAELRDEAFVENPELRRSLNVVESFLRKKDIFVATARAGNVIGGGDFSKDRIIPDYFRSLSGNKKLLMRYPNSIRPWQFVIDPLYGYLLLMMKLNKKEKFDNYSWNFGPDKSNNRSVRDLVCLINNEFNHLVRLISKNRNSKKYYESKVLMLNSSKSKRNLDWNAKYDLEDSVKLISFWHKQFLAKRNILKVSQQQVIDYFR